MCSLSYCQVYWLRFGSATPKVRHSEGLALLCNLLSLGSKLTAQINGTYLTLSLTLTITLTLLTLTVTVMAEWRTLTFGMADRYRSREDLEQPAVGSHVDIIFVHIHALAITTASTAHDKLFSSGAANSASFRLTLLSVLAVVSRLRYLGKGKGKRVFAGLYLECSGRGCNGRAGGHKNWFLCIICLYFIAETYTEIEKKYSRTYYYCTLHILSATLLMMYPARGRLDWGQIRGVSSEVRGSTPPRGSV